MRKFSKILIPLLVLSLLVGLFAVVAGAAKDEANISERLGVQSAGNGADASDGSYTDINENLVEYRQMTANSNTVNTYFDLGHNGILLGSKPDANVAMTRDYYYTVWSFDLATATTFMPELSVTAFFRFFEDSTAYESVPSYTTERANAGRITIVKDGKAGTAATAPELPTAPFIWTNFTVAADLVTGKLMVYANGELIGSTTGASKGSNYQLAYIDGGLRIEVQRPGVAGVNSFVISNYSQTMYKSADDLKGLFDGSISSLNYSGLDIPYTSPADITAGKPIVQIGDVGYASFAEALADYEAGQTITLNGDIDTRVYIDGTCTVNTNGYKFYYDYDYDGSLVAYEEGNTVRVEDWNPDTADSDVNIQFYKGEELIDNYVWTPVNTAIPAGYIPLAKDVSDTFGNHTGWVDKNGDALVYSAITGNVIVTEGLVEETEDGYVMKIYSNYTEAEGGPYVGSFMDNTGAITERYTTVDQIKAKVAAGIGEGTLLINTDITFEDDESCYPTSNNGYTFTGSTIKLYGVTMTWDDQGGANTFDYHWSTAVTIEGVEVNGVRGKLNIVYEVLFGNPSRDTVYTLRNLDITSAYRITDTRRGTLNIEGCNITATSQHAIEMTNASGNMVLNIKDSTIRTAHATNGAVVVRVAGSGSSTINISGNTILETTAAANTSALMITGTNAVNLTIDDVNVELIAGDGGLGYTSDSENVTLTLPDGYTISEDGFVKVKATNLYSTNGKNGAFVENDGAYVFTEATKVTLTLMVDGVPQEYVLVNGDTTPPELPKNVKYVTEGNKVYVYNATHWAAEPDGAAVDPDVTRDGTYYAVLAAVEADYAIYDGSDNIIYAGVETIPGEIINKHVTCTIKLLNDCEIEITSGQGTLNTGYSNAPKTYVIDLNTKTLTMTGSERYNFYNVLVSFTIKNGTFILDNNNNFATTGYGGTTHSFTLDDVDFYARSGAAIVDWRSSGTVTVKNGSNLYLENSRGHLFTFGQNSQNPSPTFTLENSTITATPAEEVTGSSNTIIGVSGTAISNVTVNITNSTINAGDFCVFMAANGAQGAICNLNITVDATTKLFTNKKVIVGGTGEYNTTTLTLAEGTELDVVGNMTNTTVVCPTGMAPVASALGEGHCKLVVGAFDINDIDVLANLTLYTDLSLNFFVPVGAGNAYGITLNGVTYVPTATTKWNGVEYYRITVSGINAYEAAANSATFAITSFNGVAVDYSVEYSVTAYLAQVMADTSINEEGRLLAANTARYIAAAYNYYDDAAELPVALAAVLASDEYTALSASFKDADDYATDGADSDYVAGNSNVAIASLQLNLDTVLKYRLNLVADFNGTLNVNGTEYTVTNGVVTAIGGTEVTDGAAYIELDVYACRVRNDIVITGIDANENDINGTYDIEWYINDEATAAKDDAFLVVLYYYCEAAEAYEATQTRG